MGLLYSLETEKERLTLAHQLREQFVKNRPNLAHLAPMPMTWEAWAMENPDKPRMHYQLWLHDILETCETRLDSRVGLLCYFSTSDKSCWAWVGRCKSPNEFKHWTRSPSHNPGSGTRHKTLEEAVQWAKNWIDMREGLIERERLTEVYKLALRAHRQLPDSNRPMTVTQWHKKTGKEPELEAWGTYIDNCLASLQSRLLGQVRHYWRYLAHCNPYPMDYEQYQEFCDGTRQQHQEYLEESLAHFKLFAPKDA